MGMKIIHIVAEKEQANGLIKLHENSTKKCFILHFYMKGCYHCDNLEPKMKRLVIICRKNLNMIMSL